MQKGIIELCHVDPIFSFRSPLVNMLRLPCYASMGNEDELFNPSKIMKRGCRIIVMNHDANFIDIVFVVSCNQLHLHCNTINCDFVVLFEVIIMVTD